jgi:hypothetical protein
MAKTLAAARSVPIGDLIVGGMVGALGLLGLLMAAKALDSEIYIFGLSLALFAVLFDFGLIRAHFDRQEKGHE